MKYGIKIIVGFLINIIFVGATIANLYNSCWYGLLSVLTALIDSLFITGPLFLNPMSIHSSHFDSNIFCIKRNRFVDRKEIYNEIREQIKNKYATENMLWIRLHGESDIGK